MATLWTRLVRLNNTNIFCHNTIWLRSFSVTKELKMIDTNDSDGEELKPSKLVRKILKLEEIDKNLYRANFTYKTSARGVYGGQIISQALAAAYKTVDHHLHVHSIHCYFLLKGDSLRPVVYQVENLRNGSRFSTRLVTAKQNSDVIFTATVSFHCVEEALAFHQYKMPDVPPPESLPSYEDLLKRLLVKDKLSDNLMARIRKYLSKGNSFHVKPVNPSTFGMLRDAKPVETKLMYWVKLKGSIDEPWHGVHQCASGYMSDSMILATALLPTSQDKLIPSMMATLDHAMWFHEPFQSDEWVLYENESPRMVGNRALCFGRLWRRDGVLVASCAQEGVIRLVSLL